MNICTKSLVKLIRSLEQRKFRRQEQQFVAEGNKLVEDLCRRGNLSCTRLIATPDWWAAHPDANRRAAECYEVSASEMERISLQPSPQEVMGTFAIPQEELDDTLIGSWKEELILALDEVQDPGNLGTIIRLCDWFGIRHILCSRGTADCYAPKVVQATMGAIAHVDLHYCDLAEVLQGMAAAGTPVYGTFLDGKTLYGTELTPHGVIVMGNEGRGISEAVRQTVTHKLYIPPFPPDATTVESLNVGIATAITVNEFRRRSIQ